jgi:hypothetical protein
MGRIYFLYAIQFQIATMQSDQPKRHTPAPKKLLRSAELGSRLYLSSSYKAAILIIIPSLAASEGQEFGLLSNLIFYYRSNRGLFIAVQSIGL